MARLPDIYQRGLLDTRSNIHEILKADPFVSKLILRNFDEETFENQSVDSMSAVATILCHARYLAHGFPARSLEYVQALAMGELMFPVMPHTSFLPAHEANEELLKIVTYLIDHETILTRGKTLQLWQEEVERARPEMADADYRFLHVEDIENPTTTNKVKYLLWLAEKLAKSQYLSALQLIVTCYVGVAKRGTVSDRFVEKVINGVRDDLGVTITLNQALMQRMYTTFGIYIKETNAAPLFNTWLSDIPEHALRLRLTLEQVGGTGLTAFIVIGKAIRRFPTFHWAGLNTLTDGEIDNYGRAVTEVNGNSYYGFKRDLGSAKSTRFSSVAFVAKELLIQISGDTSLKNYQGWIKKPKNPTVISEMINRYVQMKTEELTAGIEDDQAVIKRSNQQILEIVNRPMNNNILG